MNLEVTYPSGIIITETPSIMETTDTSAGGVHPPSNQEEAHWVLRPPGSSLFLWSSIVVVVGSAFAYSLYLFNSIGWLTYPNNSQWLVGLCIVMAFLTVPASLYLLLGMLWFWIKLDDSRRLVKGLWLLSFISLGWLAAAAYYFTVYRRRFSSNSRS